MTANLATSPFFADFTIPDVLDVFLQQFAVSALGTNSGGFNNGVNRGTQYAVANADNSYAFIAESDTGLFRQISDEGAHGDLDNLHFGSILSGTHILQSDGKYTLTEVDLSFTNLGWNSTSTHAAMIDLISLNNTGPGSVSQQATDVLAGLSASFESAISTYNNLYDNDPTYTFDTITLQQLAEVNAADLTLAGSTVGVEPELF